MYSLTITSLYRNRAQKLDYQTKQCLKPYVKLQPWFIRVSELLTVGLANSSKQTTISYTTPRTQSRWQWRGPDAGCILKGK